MLLGALLLAPLAGAAVPPASLVQERGARWYADLEEGRRVAREAGKHVLVDFSGAGWSAPSRELDRAVLARAEFADGIDPGLVLVRLEFDADLRARQDLPHAARNDALRQRLGILRFELELHGRRVGRTPGLRQRFHRGLTRTIGLWHGLRLRRYICLWRWLRRWIGRLGSLLRLNVGLWARLSLMLLRWCRRRLCLRSWRRRLCWLWCGRSS